MVEHTQVTTADVIEVTRPVAVGDGIVRADEDVALGTEIAPAGRPLRAQDLGLLAAAGVTEVVVRARPRVAIVSTGDEVVPPSTKELSPGQVRDATASALAALVTEAGGEPSLRGIVRDDVDALTKTLESALQDSDLVVVSAGSSVGARDETTAAVESLGGPGIYCHGLAVKPGKPTLLAECSDVPVIGLPGNPLSALVVFRLVGLPIRPPGRRHHPASCGADHDLPSCRAVLPRPRVGWTWCRCRSATTSPPRCSGSPRCCRSSPTLTGTS